MKWYKYSSDVELRAFILTIFPLGSIAYIIGDKQKMC